MNLTFQLGVQAWMVECFPLHVRCDVRERGDRLLEETLELLQSHGYDRTRVATLVEYVYGRPVGDPPQEVGGVMVTLAAYCLATGLDMHQCGDIELERIWTKIPEIRAKQASKRGLHTPLPSMSSSPILTEGEIAARLKPPSIAEEHCAIPEEECAAISTGHKFGPNGPDGETQCEYCGASPEPEVDPRRPPAIHSQPSSGRQGWCGVVRDKEICMREELHQGEHDYRPMNLTRPTEAQRMELERKKVEDAYLAGAQIEYYPMDDPLCPWIDAMRFLANCGGRFEWQDNDYRVKPS